MNKRALWVVLSVIALVVGLYLATVVALWFHWPPEPRDSVMGRVEKAISYTDFWGHYVQTAELVEFGTLTYGNRVQVRYHPYWPSKTVIYDPLKGCSLTGFGAREGDTIELSTVEISSCPSLSERAPTTDGPLMSPEELLKLLDEARESLRRPWWKGSWEEWVAAAQKPWVGAAQKPVEWLHKRRDASPPKQIVMSTIPGVWFEAEYKFTGLTEGEQTQLAWRYSVLLENAEGAPPKPPPRKVWIAGIGMLETRYDELCLYFAYKMVDAENYMLELHRLAGIQTKAGERQSWEATLWVNKDAAIRTNRIVGTLELRWHSGGCFSQD